MIDDVELKIRQEFIAEASEMLETVESAFMELERNPNDFKVIDKIFRLAHTIKGSALSVGFTRLGEFAHVVETLLVRVRERKLPLTPEISDLLLRSNDRLTQFVHALKVDAEATVETGDIERMIQEVLGHGVAEAPAAVKIEVATATMPAFGFFDDEPAQLPTQAAPIPLRSKVSAVDSLLKTYVEIARVAARGGAIRSALAPVLADLERTVEEAS